MIDRFERFSLANNEINRFLKKLTTEEMLKHDLKSSHALYFSLLSSSHPEGLTASQLCEYSGRDKADVSRMLALMETKGLVVKEGSHQHLYNGIYRLTDEGLRIADAVKQRAALAVNIAGKDLSPEHREIFYASLDSIVSNLRELSKKGIPDINE
ncbi:MAG: MarR family transcriptional regulator [Lachnospiraceae bacterium]|nr:MarR family transcriptional regulator [Lachnospiraceae bacterium]